MLAEAKLAEGRGDDDEEPIKEEEEEEGPEEGAGERAGAYLMPDE